MQCVGVVACNVVCVLNAFAIYVSWLCVVVSSNKNVLFITQHPLSTSVCVRNRPDTGAGTYSAVEVSCPTLLQHMSGVVCNVVCVLNAIYNL